MVNTIAIIFGVLGSMVAIWQRISCEKRLKSAKDLQKPYFLLKGYPDKVCIRPTSASASYDKIYNLTWDNLKALIGGSR